MDNTTFRSGSDRILVVDDEKYNLEIISEYLDDLDYELINADNGLQAWSILEKSPEDIDLILLDRMLPDLTGLQILAKMKDHSILKHIPVVLQTAKVARQDIIDGMQAGAFYYLTKPFEEELLRSVVKTALDEHRSYLSLQDKLKRTAQTLSLMKNGLFQFRSLKEAQELALFISYSCPVPGQVLSGLSELMINAVEHGNLGITYEEKTDLIDTGCWHDEIEHRLSLPAYSEKVATLDFQKEHDCINITIKDMGHGFNWHDYLEIAIDRVGDNHGRGIVMAKILSFDAIKYHGTGNEVTATINLQQAEEIKAEDLTEPEVA